MKILVRAFLVLLGLGAIVVLAQSVAAESGEVCVLSVTDAKGEVHTTRIWIAEDGGQGWIRGGSQAGGWASRAAKVGKVELRRAGEAVRYRTLRETDADARRRVNALFREKYGWRDTLISWMLGDPDRSGALILKLEREG